MARQLKVVLWNANGVTTRRNELHVFAVDHDLDILLLTETHLQPSNTRFSVPGYQIYRTDRPRRPGRRGNPGGGTAVLVHRRLTHRPLTTNTTFESTGVAIHVGGEELSLFAAYVAPQNALPLADIDSLLNTQGATIVGGDFNAKHATWGSRHRNAKGRVLRAHLDARGDTAVAAPVEPTHYPPRLNARPDILDIFLVNGIQAQLEASVVDDLSSDHIPVMITINACPTGSFHPPGAMLRTDWRRFAGALEGKLEPPPPADTTGTLDLQLQGLHDLLSDAIAEATSPAPPRPTRSTLPPYIRQAIDKRRRLRRVWQRTRHPLTKRAFNRQCDIVKEMLYDYRTETWNTYLSGLELGDGSAWKLAKALRNEKRKTAPLHGQRGLVYTAADKAEAFADTMEEQFRPHANIYDERTIDMVENHLDDFFSTDPDDMLEPINIQEVQAAVSKAKPRKAPGIDGIAAKALQAAPAALLLHLVVLFNSALQLCHFPASWKAAKVILIPKPGKSTLFPQNFRPISLLPTISKMFERLLLARLSPILDGYIRPEQFGFRRGHSTTQQLVRVVNKLVDNHNFNLCSVAVLLDVSKAFDKVWHEGLLYKLAESPLPAAAVHLLRSYLSGRTFQIYVEGELSTVRPIESGVPQGSVLGPVLYLVFTNDMPLVPRVTLSLYADDALFFCHSFSPARAAIVMQQQMDLLSPWLEKWRIAINADKSSAICFRKRRRMPRAVPPQITLDDEPIAWQPAIKYLGVTIDSRLNFGAHARRKVREAKQISGFLAPIIGRRSTLPIAVKSTIYLAVVRSIMMYACTAWWALCSQTNRKKLQTVQNKALRSITRQPWFVRNSTIQQGLRTSTLHAFAWITSQKLFTAAAASTQPHIADIVRRDGPAEDFRPRPAAILDFEPP